MNETIDITQRSNRPYMVGIMEFIHLKGGNYTSCNQAYLIIQSAIATSRPTLEDCVVSRIEHLIVKNNGSRRKDLFVK